MQRFALVCNSALLVCGDRLPTVFCWPSMAAFGQHKLSRGGQLAPWIPPHAQDYVRARLIQFAMPFGRRVAPALPPNLLEQAAAQTIAMIPPPEYGPASVENRDLQLVFRHDCL